MPLGTPRARFLGLIAVSIVGCGGGDSLLRGGPASVGSLKTVINRLEFENEKLRREVADAQTERARVAERLDQEQAANTDLTAQLDRLRDPGGTELVDRPSPRTTPANGTTKGRKPPFARIPGGVEQTPSLEVKARPTDDPAPIRRRSSESIGPEGRRKDADDDMRWLPVARDPMRVSR